MEKTHWKKVFNSDYLGSCDLEDGKDLKAIIKHVNVQQVLGSDGKKSDCNIAHFTDEKLKPMILNVTNCKVVKKFAKSNFINDWNNIAIQIFVDSNVKVGREITEGLRIREAQPKFNKPELLPTMPAWANVIKHLRGTGTMDEVKSKYDISATNEEALKTELLKEAAI